jgi:hypothetical protein
LRHETVAARYAKIALADTGVWLADEFGRQLTAVCGDFRETIQERA